MKKNILIIILLAFVTLGGFAQKEKSTVTETINGKKYYKHTVQKDQTLYSISKLYSTTVNDIVIENPEAIDGIKPGQVLKIAFTKSSTPIEVKAYTKADSTKFIFHQVEKGQTLYSLSKQYGIPVDEIQQINPEIKEGLKEGQILKITKNKTTAIAVQKKDTLPKEKPIVAPNSTMLPVTTIPDSIMFQKKDEYNVALFLPFNLSEAEKIDVERIAKGDGAFPAKTDVAVLFYQGVLMAIDSMKNKGLSCKLFVYDIDEKDSTALSDILKKPELKEMDLILGPLYYSNVKDVTKFANENKIHNVSPLSQLNKILFKNPYTSKTVPSSVTQAEQITKYALEKYGKENIILVGARKDPSSYSTLKKIIDEERLKNKQDTVPVTSSSANTASLLSTTKKNIIIFPSNDQAYVTDFITKLEGSAKKHDILLFGMPSWRNFDNLDPEYLDTLHLHIPSAFYVNYDDSATINFIRKFRGTYLSDPENFAFQGYDVALFYLSQLYEHGANFHFRLNGTKSEGLQTLFSFYRSSEGSGYDNDKVYILKHIKHQLVRVQ